MNAGPARAESQSAPADNGEVPHPGRARRSSAFRGGSAAPCLVRANGPRPRRRANTVCSRRTGNAGPWVLAAAPRARLPRDRLPCCCRRARGRRRPVRRAGQATAERRVAALAPVLPGLRTPARPALIRVADCLVRCPWPTLCAAAMVWAPFSDAPRPLLLPDIARCPNRESKPARCRPLCSGWRCASDDVL